MHLLLDPREDTKVQVALWSGKGAPCFYTHKRDHGSLLAVIAKKLLTTHYSLQTILIIPGPGNFSTVRGAVVLANTLGFARDIPVIAVQPRRGEGAIAAFRRALGSRSVSKQPVMPLYGKEPNITRPLGS